MMLPVSDAVSEVAGAARLTFSVAVLVSGVAAVGLNVTLIVHVAPGASAFVVPVRHPPTWLVAAVNWLAFVPLSAMLLITIGADPPLVTVTVCTALVTFSGELKVSEAGEIPPFGLVPVPITVTVYGLVFPVCWFVNVPFSRRGAAVAILTFV